MALAPSRHHFQDSRAFDFATYLRADALARGTHLVQATPAEDRQFGIDDWLNLPHEGVVSVDWKTDHRAAVTGNLAIEIISNASIGKLGWVFTSQADYIVYLLPVPSRLLWFKTAILRQAVIDWQNLYPTRGAHNDNREDRFLYTTWSLTAPLATVALLADLDKPQELLVAPPDCLCPSCLTARATLAPPPPPPVIPLPHLNLSDNDLV